MSKRRNHKRDQQRLDSQTKLHYLVHYMSSTKDSIAVLYAFMDGSLYVQKTTKDSIAVLYAFMDGAAYVNVMRHYNIALAPGDSWDAVAFAFTTIILPVCITIEQDE